MNTFANNEEYDIQKLFVLSNERVISHKGEIAYLPIFLIMFFEKGPTDRSNLRFWYISPKNNHIPIFILERVAYGVFKAARFPP